MNNFSGEARSCFAGQFQKGQALITLLFFVIIAATITGAATIIIAVNTTATSKLEEGATAYYAAESGIENAMLRILRDQIYTGETLTIDGATVVISVTGSNPKTVVSVGKSGNFKRTIQAQTNYSNGYYTVSTWKEV